MPAGKLAAALFWGTGLSILALLIPGRIWVRQIDKAAATSHLVIQSPTSQIKVVSSIVIFCINCGFIKFTGQSPFLVAAVDPDWTYIRCQASFQFTVSPGKTKPWPWSHFATWRRQDNLKAAHWKKDSMPRCKAGVVIRMKST